MYIGINGSDCHYGTVLAAAPFVALDTETTGLHRGARVRSIQFGFIDPRNGHGAAFVLPLEYADGEPDDCARAAAVTLLGRIEVSWAYNAGFDERVIHDDLGVSLRIHDAAALHHLVDNIAATGREPLKKEIAKRTGGPSPITAKDTLRMSAHDPAFLMYAALDAAILAECIEEWGADRRAMEWLHRERRIADACDAMTRRGLLLDTVEAVRIKDAADRRAAAFSESAASLTDGVTPNRTKAVTAAIKARGVSIPTVRRKRPDGSVYYGESTSRKDLMSDDPLVLAVQGYRKQASVSSTVEQWFKHVEPDGRIRSRLRPLGAATARWSSSSPNIQNVSKRSETGDEGEMLVMRSAFVASPGSVWVQADLSQIEYRVAAGLSGDTAMLKAFEESGDLHLYAARALSGVESPTKQDRSTAKAIGFGKLYGQSLPTTAAKLGVPLSVMQERVEAYDAAFPRLAEWGREVAAYADRTMVTPVNPYGRSLRVHSGYMAVNYLCQSTAREVFCDWMLNVVNAGLGYYIAAGIHDELILEVPEDMAQEALETVLGCAASVDTIGVPVVAEGLIAHGSWAAAYEED